MICLMRNDKIALYTLERSQAHLKTSLLPFELRDLEEVKDKFSADIIALITQMLKESEYYPDDIRLSSSYKKKVYKSLQSKMLSLKVLYKYLEKKDTIIEIAHEKLSAVPFVYPDLGLMQMSLERISFSKVAENNPLYDGISDPVSLDEASKNSQVLMLMNEFSPKKITW